MMPEDARSGHQSHTCEPLCGGWAWNQVLQSIVVSALNHQPSLQPLHLNFETGSLTELGR